MSILELSGAFTCGILEEPENPLRAVEPLLDDDPGRMLVKAHAATLADVRSAAPWRQVNDPLEMLLATLLPTTFGEGCGRRVSRFAQPTMGRRDAA